MASRLLLCGFICVHLPHSQRVHAKGERAFLSCEPMTRIQLELADEKVKELEELMSQVGLKTKKDLLNNALTLLEWAVRERSQGRIIASVDEEDEKYKEIVMPVLQNVPVRLTRNAVADQNEEAVLTAK